MRLWRVLNARRASGFMNTRVLAELQARCQGRLRLSGTIRRPTARNQLSYVLHPSPYPSPKYEVTQSPFQRKSSGLIVATLEPVPPPGLTIAPLEPPGGVTLEVGGTIPPAPLEGVAPTLGTLELPGATMLETSPLAGSTGVKLEGAAMLEADRGVMLGGRTELGGSRLI